MKTTFTREEVKDIVGYIFYYYNIENSDKYREDNFSKCNDEPSVSEVTKAYNDTVDSFIY